MSKKRVIACIIVRNNWAVQSIGFSKYLPVGRPEIAARFLDDWGVDEIVLLDISATPEGRTIDSRLVERVAKSCHVPLAVGGGIRSLDDVRTILQAGADKICINSAAYETPSLVTEAASRFGDQCVIASMDVKSGGNGYRIWANGASSTISRTPSDWARELALLGAGEILLGSVDRDGMHNGFDFKLIEEVATQVDIPVIAVGGCGRPEHLFEALQKEYVSAAAAANFWHYTEHAVATAKSAVIARGVDVRNDALADYRWMDTDHDGRAAKRDDLALEALAFQFIPDEVI